MSFHNDQVAAPKNTMMMMMTLIITDNLHTFVHLANKRIRSHFCSLVGGSNSPICVAFLLTN